MPRTGRAVALGAALALGAAAPGHAAVEVFDVNSSPGTGFSSWRLGPDGSVAGTVSDGTAPTRRGAVWRPGRPLQVLSSSGAASATDVAADGRVVGFGKTGLSWSPPGFSPTPVDPPLPPPRASLENGDAWLTASGRLVLERSERLEIPPATYVFPVAAWVDGERLARLPQSETGQDSVDILDVAESGWILAWYRRFERSASPGGTPVWAAPEEGPIVFRDASLQRFVPWSAGLAMSTMYPTLVDDRGTIYGTLGTELGSMAATSTAFEPLALPPDLPSGPAGRFRLAAASGDGILLGTAAGPDGGGGTADDEAYLRRGRTGSWTRLRPLLPTTLVPPDAGVQGFDVNPSGDVLLRIQPQEARGYEVVIRSRTRVTGNVAAPPAAPTRAAAIKVVATSLDGLPAVTATVANGRYELLLAAGRWTIALSGATGCAGTGACATTKTLTVDGEHDQTLAWRTDPATNPAPTTIRKGARLKARKGKLAIPLRCRLVSRRCTGTIALLPKKGTKPLATTALNAKPGTRTTATLTLPKAVKTRIAGTKTIPIRIRITTRLTGTTTTTITAAILD